MWKNFEKSDDGDNIAKRECERCRSGNMKKLVFEKLGEERQRKDHVILVPRF